MECADRLEQYFGHFSTSHWYNAVQRNTMWNTWHLHFNVPDFQSTFEVVLFMVLVGLCFSTVALLVRESDVLQDRMRRDRDKWFKRQRSIPSSWLPDAADIV